MARGLAVAVAALLAAAAPAQAASGTFTCPNLQGGINQAVDGDVITVDGICTGQFTLKNFGAPSMNYSSWTLQGVGGDDGFDRNSIAGRALTGVDTHRLVIQNLTFRDGSAMGPGESGGAIDVTGHSGLQVFNSSFFNNHASDRGGAIHVAAATPAPLSGFNNLGVSMLGNVFGSTTVPGDGNSATIGGAVSVQSPGVNDQFSLTDNLFANNTAAWDGGAFDFELVPDGDANVNLNGNDVIDNNAGGSGGGGHLLIENTALRVDNELYQGNSIETLPGSPQGDHFGGGLYVLGGGDGGQVIMRDNVFRSNVLNTVSAGNNYGGGGLAVIGALLNVTSEFTRIEGNSVAGQPDADFDSEGGGDLLLEPLGTLVRVPGRHRR